MSDRSSIKLLFFCVFLIAVEGLLQEHEMRQLKRTQETLIEWVDQLNKHTKINMQGVHDA